MNPLNNMLWVEIARLLRTYLHKSIIKTELEIKILKKEVENNENI